MDMYGWDSISLVSMDRINRSLVDNSDGLLLAFDYSDDQCSIKGQFGPWQLVAGAEAPGVIWVDLPILEGELELPMGDALTLEGVTVRVQIPLALMPASDGQGRELRFDFSTDTNAPGALAVRTIAVAGAQLDPLVTSVLGDAVARCLTSSQDSISCVFAHVGAPAPSAFKWLVPDDCRWRQLQVSGQSFLVLFGVGAKAIDQLAPNLDQKAFTPLPDVAFYFAADRFMEGAVLPHMNANFYKGAKFSCRQGIIKLARALNLPAYKYSWAYTARPKIESMDLRLVGSVLTVVSKGSTNAPMGITLSSTVTNKLPFHFDTNSKKVGFKPDHHPKVETHLSLPGLLDTILGWFVRWIGSFFTAQIQAPLAQISKSLQTVSHPAPAVLAWRGVQDFKLSDARLDGCFQMIQRA